MYVWVFAKMKFYCMYMQFYNCIPVSICVRLGLGSTKPVLQNAPTFPFLPRSLQAGGLRGSSSTLGLEGTPEHSVWLWRTVIISCSFLLVVLMKALGMLTSLSNVQLPFPLF